MGCLEAWLSVPSLTIPIDHEGPYAVDAGTATLPNGVLSETAVTLTRHA